MKRNKKSIFVFVAAMLASFYYNGDSVHANGEHHKKAVEEAGGDEDAAVKIPPGISSSGQPLPAEAVSPETTPPSATASGQNTASSAGQNNANTVKSSTGTAFTIFLSLVALCVVILGVQYISVKGTIQKK